MSVNRTQLVAKIAEKANSPRFSPMQLLQLSGTDRVPLRGRARQGHRPVLRRAR